MIPVPASFSTASQGGVAIARKIAAVYRDYPEVRAFIVGGSVSRGCADGYSDLEIGVFWKNMVPIEERRAAVERLEGELWTIDRDGRNMEHFGLYEAETASGIVTGRCMVSMNHNTVAEMDHALDAVLNRWDTNPEYQELLFVVQHAVPLYGEIVVKAWERQIGSFPDELAAKIIQENLSFGPWFIPEAYILRDDPLALYRHFLVIQQYVIRLLLGLNRLYLPSTEFKWLDHTITWMNMTPANFAERLRRVFQTPDLEAGWREQKALMFEALDLVDAHLPLVNERSFVPNRPEINTAWARKNWNVFEPYVLMEAVGNANAKP